jgi:hypothetical protein
MRRFRFLLLVLNLVCASSLLRAQNTAAPGTDAVRQVTLGNATVPLTGPWKFHIGDNPAWAQPDYDDSAWQNYVVDPAHRDLTALQAVESMDPGWQQHGHPGYTGYAWYRIRVQPAAGAKSLSLLFYLFDDTFQLYADGREIGSYGTMGSILGVYTSRPVIFRIPEDLLRSGQPVTLAIRFWTNRAEALPSGHNLNGGLRAAPIAGPEPALDALQRYLPSQMYGTLITKLWIMLSLHGSVGLICLFLFLFSRSQREYLWTAVTLLGIAAEAAVSIGVTTGSLSVVFDYFLYGLCGWAAGSSAPMAVMYLLQVPKDLWRRCTYVASGLLAAYLIADALLGLGILPPTLGSERAGGVFHIVAFIASGLLLLGIVADGLRTLGRRAWLPLTPGVFVVGALASAVINIAAGKSSLGPVWLVCWYCFPLSILFVFLARFAQQQSENAQMTSELEAARGIQSLMVPAAPLSTPGFAVDSVYLPASQVGGDFFQIIPDDRDGSVLIVVGDVAGHGLQAGMLVALIVGAIRTATDTIFDPLSVLRTLNQQLFGRGNAKATCLVLRLSPDGEATLANAGHLPPYLNGKEMAMEGALPLGVMEGAEFSVMYFQTKENDRLILLTDGIVEAMNEKKELFGFARTSALMRDEKSAVEIAAVAQAFGQEDDITVVRVVREAKVTEKISVEPALAMG